jgi:hypothetical protein
MNTIRRWQLWVGAVIVLPLALTPSTWGSAGTDGAGRALDPRTTFHLLLAEHVHLTTSTTGAAMAGRTGELAGAVRALDGNGRDLARALGAVYGPEAERRFLIGWRQHIDFFVWYAKGVVMNDASMRKKATDGLERYAVDLAAFMSAANPHLPKGAVADLLRAHTRAVLGVIEAQGAKDHARAFAAIRAAALQSATIADPLGSAIVQQFPDRFGR